MSQMDREARPQFSQPVRQIALMLMVIALSAAMVFVAAPSVLPVFQANPYLNGFIFFVFLIGVVACFWQVVQLVGSVRWIEGFAADTQVGNETPPQLLAPLASLLRTRGARMQVSSSSTRSILDSVATRIDEAREITGRWPECRCANVSLWNRHMQTYDYSNRQVSLNRAQTQLEPDGRFRMLLAHRDPGAPNWLDTEGRPFGMVFWRFMLPEGSIEKPETRVVPFDSLAGG